MVQDATLADTAILADPGTRMQDAAGPDLRPGRHGDLGEQHRSRPDRRFRSDDAERSDRGAVADFRSWVDNGAGVDTGNKVQRGRQELRQPRQRDPEPPVNCQTAGEPVRIDLHSSRDDGRAGVGAAEQGVGTLVHGQRQGLAMLSEHRMGGRGDRKVAVTDNFRAQQLGEVIQCMRFGR